MPLVPCRVSEIPKNAFSLVRAAVTHQSRHRFTHWSLRLHHLLHPQTHAFGSLRGYSPASVMLITSLLLLHTLLHPQTHASGLLQGCSSGKCQSCKCVLHLGVLRAAGFPACSCNPGCYARLCRGMVVGTAELRCCVPIQQGWDNFRKEFKQLRRSFRFNEYGEIRSAAPPKTFVARVRRPSPSCFMHTPERS